MGGKYRLMGRRARDALRMSLLQRAVPIIRSGAMQEPTWLKSVMQMPPILYPKYRGKKGDLVFPTDRLVREYEKRNPRTVKEPIWAGAGGLPSHSYRFATRQHAKMESGICEKDAYRVVEDEMDAERRDDVKRAASLVEGAREVAGGGNPPSFLGSDSVHKAFMEWRAMMTEIPYAQWELGAKASLDYWLMTQVIGVLEEQLQTMRSVEDGSMERLEEETEQLRLALFTGAHASPEIDLSPLLETRYEDEEWASSLSEWRTKAKNNPFLHEWPVEDQVTFDTWIVRNCLNKTALAEQLAYGNNKHQMVTGELTEGNSVAGEGEERDDESELFLKDDLLPIVNAVKCILVPDLQLSSSRNENSGSKVGDEKEAEEDFASIAASDSNIATEADFLREQQRIILLATRRDRRFKAIIARKKWEKKMAWKRKDPSVTSPFPIFDQIMEAEQETLRKKQEETRRKMKKLGKDKESN